MTDLDAIHSRLDAALVRFGRRGTPKDEDELFEAAWDALGALESMIVEAEPLPAGRVEAREFGETVWRHTCGRCGKPIDPGDKFCRRCGKAVLWA